MISSRSYGITLEVAGVNRKQAHTQEGRRTILRRFVRAGCLENPYSDACSSGMGTRLFTNACMHATNVYAREPVGKQTWRLSEEGPKPLRNDREAPSQLILLFTQSIPGTLRTPLGWDWGRLPEVTWVLKRKTMQEGGEVGHAVRNLCKNLGAVWMTNEKEA